jgi:hypothetical protein
MKLQRVVGRDRRGPEILARELRTAQRLLPINCHDRRRNPKHESAPAQLRAGKCGGRFSQTPPCASAAKHVRSRAKNGIRCRIAIGKISGRDPKPHSRRSATSDTSLEDSLLQACHGRQASTPAELARLTDIPLLPGAHAVPAVVQR